jgi:hypothetical protein
MYFHHSFPIHTTLVHDRDPSATELGILAGCSKIVHYSIQTVCVVDRIVVFSSTKSSPGYHTLHCSNTGSMLLEYTVGIFRI